MGRPKLPESKKHKPMKITLPPETHKWLKEQGASSWINSAVKKQMQEDGIPAALKNQAE
jgi:hypothetical protein